jgi:hypothetical protein
MGGAAGAVVATALGGLLPAKKASADSSPPVWCPDTEVHVIGVCGGKGCTAQITVGGTSTQLPFIGAGGLGASSGSVSVVDFKNMKSKSLPGGGKICTKKDCARESTATAGSASQGGGSVNTIVSNSIAQKFTYIPSGGGSPTTYTPDALDMDLTSSSATNGNAYGPAAGFTEQEIAPGVMLTGFSVSVKARPKTAGGAFLLSIVNLRLDTVGGAHFVKFNVRRALTANPAINGDVDWWIQNPDDESDTLYPTGTVAWPNGQAQDSNEISVALASYPDISISAGSKIVAEAGAADDSRTPFNYAVLSF